MANALAHIGLAPFLLGMSRAGVRAAAGEPDSIIASRDDERTLESWFYQGGAIELEFDAAPDARLESVTVWAPDHTLAGVALVEAPADRLAELAEDAGLDDLVLSDDFGDGERCFYSETASLMIWVARGRVVNFTLFPRFDDSGEQPLWPAV